MGQRMRSNLVTFVNGADFIVPLRYMCYGNAFSYLAACCALLS